MPSQDDYLDKLLMDLPEEEEDEGEETVQIPQIMEEDQLQDEGTGYWQDITDESEDSNVQEIQDLLDKFDRNETIDSEAADTDAPESGESPADRLRADIEKGETEAEEAVDSRKKKALEKKRLKEEKAAAKKAAKEAAKARKEEKRRQRKKKDGSEPDDSLPGNGGESIAEYDLLADKDLLDSIVSEAGHLHREEPSEEEATAGTSAGNAKGADDKIRDILDGGSGISDIIALDMDEMDSILPDISQETDNEEKPKKKGLMSKFVDFLMEEEEETENEDVKMSEENQEILDELDREKEEPGKEKKPKKKKAKKAKEKKKKEAKPKKAKPPKPKKEKKPKEPEPYIPGKKLTFRKMLPVLLLGATLGAVIFILAYLSVDYMAKREAVAAYEAGDYRSCYLSLYGKKLNETEAEMYGKSESILSIQLCYQEYQKIAQDGSDAEILDNLIQVVNKYPALQAYALQWNAASEVDAVYSQLLAILYERFGVTEEQAREIAAIKGDIAYTKAVMALVEGKGYKAEEIPNVPEDPSAQNPDGAGADDIPGSEDIDGEEPDVLPEESEIESGNFVDGGAEL